MQDQNEWRRWLAQAQYDLAAARHSQTGGFYALACFLAQQVAEKALKAFLYAHGERAVLGHSVSELCARCAATNQAFAPLCPSGGKLDRYYIPTRYPNGLPGGVPAEAYARDDAESALALAEQFVQLVNRLVGT